MLFGDGYRVYRAYAKNITYKIDMATDNNFIIKMICIVFKIWFQVLIGGFMDDCVFCKIISGKIPSLKFYEDDKCIAILDINPANKGHSLIISKEHFSNIYDIDDEVLSDMILVAKRVAKAVKENFECDGVNIIMNNEKAAGQIIPHAHIHVIPRFENDEVVITYKKKELNKDEFIEIMKKLMDSVEKVEQIKEPAKKDGKKHESIKDEWYFR